MQAKIRPSSRSLQSCRICFAVLISPNNIFSIFEAPGSDVDQWKNFVLDSMQLRVNVVVFQLMIDFSLRNNLFFQLPGHYNVSSTICKECNDDLHTAFKLFQKAVESTLYFTRQQGIREAKIALNSRNGDSAANLKPEGKKTYFSDDISELQIKKMDDSILQHCDEMDCEITTKPEMSGESTDLTDPNEV